MDSISSNKECVQKSIHTQLVDVLKQITPGDSSNDFGWKIEPSLVGGISPRRSTGIVKSCFQGTVQSIQERFCPHGEGFFSKKVYFASKMVWHISQLTLNQNVEQEIATLSFEDVAAQSLFFVEEPDKGLNTSREAGKTLVECASEWLRLSSSKLFANSLGVEGTKMFWLTYAFFKGTQPPYATGVLEESAIGKMVPGWDFSLVDYAGEQERYLWMVTQEEERCLHLKLELERDIQMHTKELQNKASKSSYSELKAWPALTTFCESFSMSETSALQNKGKSKKKEKKAPQEWRKTQRQFIETGLPSWENSIKSLVKDEKTCPDEIRLFWQLYNQLNKLKQQLQDIDHTLRVCQAKKEQIKAWSFVLNHYHLLWKEGCLFVGSARFIRFIQTYKQNEKGIEEEPQAKKEALILQLPKNGRSGIKEFFSKYSNSKMYVALTFCYRFLSSDSDATSVQKIVSCKMHFAYIGCKNFPCSYIGCKIFPFVYIGCKIFPCFYYAWSKMFLIDLLRSTCAVESSGISSGMNNLRKNHSDEHSIACILGFASSLFDAVTFSSLLEGWIVGRGAYRGVNRKKYTEPRGDTGHTSADGGGFVNHGGFNDDLECIEDFEAGDSNCDEIDGYGDSSDSSDSGDSVWSESAEGGDISSADRGKKVRKKKAYRSGITGYRKGVSYALVDFMGGLQWDCSNFVGPYFIDQYLHTTKLLDDFRNCRTLFEAVRKKSVLDCKTVTSVPFYMFNRKCVITDKMVAESITTCDKAQVLSLQTLHEQDFDSTDTTDTGVCSTTV